MNVREAWVNYEESRQKLVDALMAERERLADQVDSLDDGEEEERFLPWGVEMDGITITRFETEDAALGFVPGAVAARDCSFEIWYYNAPNNKGVTRCRYVWASGMWKASKPKPKKGTKR